MIDPPRFPDDPAIRHADERFMTPRHPDEEARTGSLWRTPAAEFRDPYRIDHDRLEDALDALDFEDASEWEDWHDDEDWREAMRHRARASAGGAVDFARRNPVGTALALAGVALLFAPRVEREDVRAMQADARAGGARMARQAGARLRGAAAGQLANSERASSERAGSARGRAELRQRLARMRRQIEDGTEGMNAEARRQLVAARHRTLDARERALDEADRLRARAERQARAGMETAREHPVLTGTLALALGAAIAAALPGPRRRLRHSRVGEMSRRLMREAEDIYERESAILASAARGAWHEARDFAAETAREARDRVPDGERLVREGERRAEHGMSRIAEGARREARRSRGG